VSSRSQVSFDARLCCAYRHKVVRVFASSRLAPLVLYTLLPIFATLKFDQDSALEVVESAVGNPRGLSGSLLLLAGRFSFEAVVCGLCSHEGLPSLLTALQ
jgi:hypothetical protein